MTRRRWYPVAALGLLAAVDGVHGFALLILGPDIARAIGVGPGTIAAVAVLSTLMAALGALGAARVVATRGRPARVAVATGGIWSAGSVVTAFVTGPWGLATVVAADGAATGSVHTVHPALLADTYAGRRQTRAIAAHRALNTVGIVAAPAIVGLLSAVGLTWRGVFLVAGVMGLLAVAAATGLRDPRPAPAAVARTDAPTLGEHARALLAVPTMRRLLAAYAVAGILLAPLLSYLFFFLEDRWGLDAAERGAFLAASGLTTIVAIALFTSDYERRAERSARALVEGAWPLIAFGGVALGIAVVAPWFGVAVAAFCAALAALALVEVPLLALIVRLARGGARPVAMALASIALAGVGGFGGVLLLGGTQDTLGIDAAVALLSVPAVLSALVLRTAAPTADADVAAARRAEARDSAAASRRASGGRRPLLVVEEVSFAYEHHPVLDEVSFAVEEGETVVVLGTNGAGKSTLLRVMSGLLAPQRGAVRFRDADITWFAPERRARLGIAHVPAERSTFGPLTVHEGLYVAALARSRPADARRSVAEALERLPLLAARADVRAAALSAGEIRLLALAQALIGEPALLLVDEPTRGLAPAAAAEVLAAIGARSAAGRTTVVVEQSAERGLRLGRRAIFLEAGGLRYDGASTELAGRGDLLRPVFLQDAGGQRAPRASHPAQSGSGP